MKRPKVIRLQPVTRYPFNHHPVLPPEQVKAFKDAVDSAFFHINVGLKQMQKTLSKASAQEPIRRAAVAMRGLNIDKHWLDESRKVLSLGVDHAGPQRITSMEGEFLAWANEEPDPAQQSKGIGRQIFEAVYGETEDIDYTEVKPLGLPASSDPQPGDQN